MQRTIPIAVSKKQLAANRRNAKLSTGPMTPQGKAVASSNAITSGLHTKQIVINSPYLTEDPEQYNQLLQSLLEEFRPDGVLQQHLVVKIANCLWRYRRVISAETAQIQSQLESSADHQRIISSLRSDYDDTDDTEYEPDPDKISVGSIPSGSFRLNLMHYEMRLDKQLTRAYQLLIHLQLLSKSKRLSDHYPISEISPNEPISPQPNGRLSVTENSQTRVGTTRVFRQR